MLPLWCGSPLSQSSRGAGTRCCLCSGHSCNDEEDLGDHGPLSHAHKSAFLPTSMTPLMECREGAVDHHCARWASISSEISVNCRYLCNAVLQCSAAGIATQTSRPTPFVHFHCPSAADSVCRGCDPMQSCQRVDARSHWYPISLFSTTRFGWPFRVSAGST